jgi:hypothetical protein
LVDRRLCGPRPRLFEDETPADNAAACERHFAELFELLDH